MGVAQNRRAIIRTAAVGAVWAGLAGGAYAADTIYTGIAGGTWDADANWTNTGDGIFGNGDDTNVQPGAADAAIILDGKTVNVDSTETVLELQLSVPQNAADSGTPGTARLNVLPGANLTTNGNSSGIRAGRALDVGQALGTSRAEIIQTGGAVNIAQGANGLRLSQAETTVGDSLYRISGGAVRGASGAGVNAVSDLRLGATTNNFLDAEFHVVGSAATEIRFLDVQVADSTTTSGGRSTVHFSLDAGGVTPIVAEDEFQFRAASAVGVGILEVDLIAEAPQADVTLVIADRLGNNGGALEQFFNYAEGATVVAAGAGWEYTYTIDYTDAGDNFQTVGAPGLDASIVLHYVSRTAIPEPGSLALLAAGAGLGLVRRRRRA